ncbi:Signal transduction histidine kinase [Variovorax sp. NFACC28]|nr:Signal transduction histidine kinase [Variovorax sp. NFACC28]SEG34447.1 Signal transduction histidine kinase [Variovorax sp. NFACC29]SFC37059.1 Signal transduction histidine kinase [Variovorax sp. NFACC26]SFF88782.1 Signal transduction histidine kinase [Variovorax sp. NFACC27]
MATALPAAWADVLRIDDETRWPIALDTRVEVFEDTGARMSLDEVDALPGDGPDGFQPGTPARMRPGFSKSAFWLRLTVVNGSDAIQPLRLVLDATWLQHVDFHARRELAGWATWTHEQAGVSVRSSAARDHDRVPTLDLDLRPGEQARVLVRVRTNSSVKLVPKLYSADAWRMSESSHALLDGLLIGGLLVLSVYSLSLWVISRHLAMALQSMGFALVALYESTYRGHARLALWPDSIEWSYRAAGVTAGCCVLSLMFYLYTVSRRGPVRVPGLRWLVVLALAQCVVVLGTLLGPYAPFATAGTLSAPLVVLSLTVSTFVYMRRAGPGGRLAFPVMTIVAVGVCLRLVELAMPSHMIPGFDAYALGFPGMLVGLVALAVWAHHLSRQRHSAQRTLAHWQAEEQQRLQDEVERKTHALNAALEQAEQQSRDQTQLLAYISHDLRAPLSTIVGNVRLLDVDGPPPPERLQAIERSAAYQLALIDDLLDYARSELLPFSFEPRPVHLRALIDDIAQYADTLAQRQRNLFELDVLGALPTAVQLDSKRFQQLLLNLLSNAAKFTRDGKIGLRVQARPRQDSWRLEFDVWDSGVGIEKEDQARIVKAFEQGAPSSNGHGFGLTIARRIVQHMGGRMQLESRRNLGTRVRFSVIVKEAPKELVPVVVKPPPRPVLPVPAPAGKARRMPVPAIAPLPAAVRDELETLARDGRWSDLHEWADRLAADARHSALVEAVRHALDLLDFEHIRLLARATPNAGQ